MYYFSCVRNKITYTMDIHGMVRAAHAAMDDGDWDDVCMFKHVLVHSKQRIIMPVPHAPKRNKVAMGMLRMASTAILQAIKGVFLPTCEGETQAPVPPMRQLLPM